MCVKLLFLSFYIAVQGIRVMLTIPYAVENAISTTVNLTRIQIKISMVIDKFMLY